MCKICKCKIGQGFYVVRLHADTAELMGNVNLIIQIKQITDYGVTCFIFYLSVLAILLNLSSKPLMLKSIP